MLSIATLIIKSNSAKVTNYEKNNNHLSKILNNGDTRKSLTSMFINNQLGNSVHVGQKTNLNEITNTQIQKVISQEILDELNISVNTDIIQQLDYDIEVNTLDKLLSWPKLVPSCCK